ncbi:unnamed protein product, partial [Amoebophrya sp. A25]
SSGAESFVSQDGMAKEIRSDLTSDADLSKGSNNWSTVHTWLTFQIFADGREKTFVLDMTAPQFGIFGEKISVFERIVGSREDHEVETTAIPSCPEIWSFIQEQRTSRTTVFHPCCKELEHQDQLLEKIPDNEENPERDAKPSTKTPTPLYDPTPGYNLPVNFSPGLFQEWIYGKTNHSSVACKKIKDVSNTFLERRYPPSVRSLPRPYNVPELPDRSKFFGIGVTDSDDGQSIDLLTNMERGIAA